jgi:hypothetical protein
MKNTNTVIVAVSMTSPNATPVVISVSKTPVRAWNSVAYIMNSILFNTEELTKARTNFIEWASNPNNPLDSIGFSYNGRTITFSKRDITE